MCFDIELLVVIFLNISASEAVVGLRDSKIN